MTENKPKIVVSVNGVEMTEEEAQKRANMQMRQMAMGGRVSPQQLQSMMPQISQQVVNNFIAQVLLTQEAEKEKVDVDEEAVAAEMKQIETRLPEGTTLEEAVSAQGMTLDEVKKDIRENLAIRKLLDAKLPKDVTVSDEEIKAFYDENLDKMKQPETVKASHILVKVDDMTDADAKAAGKAKIDGIKKQLADGGDFAELAEENSDCPSGKNGGDLGQFGRGQMVKPFEDAAFTQDTDVIGPVVETKFGYHIIKVTGHDKAKTSSLEEVSENIESHLESQKKSQGFNDYIEKLKADAKIVFPGQPDAN